jgi:oxygen-independent coproporphyrinogen III oxidase
MIRELILQMKLGHVSAPYFQGKFGVDIHQRFGASLDKLRELGFLAIDANDADDADGVRLNRDGLLQVDRLLHEFFLPQHRHARYT